MSLNIDFTFNDALDASAFAIGAYYSSEGNFASNVVESRLKFSAGSGMLAHQAINYPVNSCSDLLQKTVQVAFGSLRAMTALGLGVSVKTIATSNSILKVEDAGVLGAFFLVANRVFALAQKKVDDYFLSDNTFIKNKV